MFVAREQVGEFFRGAADVVRFDVPTSSSTNFRHRTVSGTKHRAPKRLGFKCRDSKRLGAAEEGVHFGGRVLLIKLLSRDASVTVTF